MSPSLFSLLIWLPFLIPALLFGIIFSILGFKRGSIKASISVAITAVSALLSILLARLVAGTFAFKLTPFVHSILGGNGETLFEKEHFAALITGCATALGALVLFIPCFMLLLLLLKNLTSLVFARGIPKAEHVGNKLGGMVIGFVDALLVAFLLLLPLYGTLGIGGDILATMSSLEGQSRGSDDVASQLNITLLSTDSTIRPTAQEAHRPVAADFSEPVTLLQSLCQAPLAKLATTPIFSSIYNSMASFTYEGETVSVTKTVQTVSHVVDAINAYQSGNETDSNRLARAFDQLEDLVTGSNFYAGLVCDLVENLAEDEDSFFVGYEGFADKEILRGDLPAIFTLVRSAVENNLLSMLMSGHIDLSEIDLGTFPYAMAEALNSTESLAKWKAGILNGAMDMVFESLADGEEGSTTVAELKALLGTVSATPLTGDARRAEGDSLYLILNALIADGDESSSMKRMGDIIEGLARHPAFGVEKVTQLASKLMEVGEMGENSTILDTISEALTNAVAKPVGESSFGDFLQATVDTANALKGVADGKTDPDAMEKLLKADAGALLQVKETLSADLLGELGLPTDTAEKVDTLFDALFETISSANLSDAEAKEEAAPLSAVLTVLAGTDDKTGNKLTDVIAEPQAFLDAYLESRVLTETVSKLTSSADPDPLDLFGSLGKNGKKEMANLIKETHADHVGSDSSVTDKLNDLATFLGISLSLS